MPGISLSWYAFSGEVSLRSGVTAGMSFEDFENIFTLFFTIVGLLACLFKYIETPKRTYFYLTGFFLARFMSDYFWTVYELVTGSYPEVSGFTAYLGWNIAYACLFLSMLSFIKDHDRLFFHPVMLWPVLTNVPLLFLYLRYGGVFNNLWQVGITTLIMILCTGEIIYYLRNRIFGTHFPYFAILILVFCILEYGMWTASCYSWKSELSDPYTYCSLLSAIVVVFFAWGVGKGYESALLSAGGKDETEVRFMAAVHTILSFLIFLLCVVGYLIAVRANVSQSDNMLTIVIFTVSAALVGLIILLLYISLSRYKIAQNKRRDMEAGKRSRFNLIFTILVTLVLMAFAVIYNTMNYYNISVSGVYVDGENAVEMTASDLDNYLTVAETTLRVAADTVDLMEQNGDTSADILRYITDQTRKQSEQFDENFTGIYAYVNGDYLDGSGWVPPEGYEPVTRDWYSAAIEADGEVVIVSPYQDAQTGSVVITIAKSIFDQNVVCLDVIVNYIKDITEQVNIGGKGYGMVVNGDGFIVAHQNEEYNGKNLADIYTPELLDEIFSVKDGRINAVLNGEDTTLFISPIMDQWVDVIAVSDAELLEDVRSQLFVNIIVSLITFCLIAFFYYLGYRNELAYGKKVEEMNIQVVSALAAAIDAKDNYTNGHSSRVAMYSKMIAERIGYSEPKQDEIYMMGLLHDVGKIGVPDEVINKPAKLTDEEFELIKKHPVIGSGILESIKERPKLSIGARWHHERFAGGGYPDGIKGEEIPEEARIIAVADAYDAMTSRRSYRKVMPQEKVREEIAKGSGIQFDPRFAEIMLRLIDEDKGYSMRGI